MIVANMATFPARAEGLEEAVRRLAPEVDRINLCLNEYSEIPAWTAAVPKLNPVIPNQDLKDLGKFMFSHDPDEDVLLVDDDIAYPRGYAAAAIEDLGKLRDHLGKSAVGGYHGTIYLRRSLSRLAKDLIRGRGLSGSHLGRAKILHAYHDALQHPRIVTQLGTGTVVLKGCDMPDLSFMMGADRRADVRFARWCFDRGLPLIALPRTAGWMPASGNDDVSIYRTYTAGLPKEFVEEVAAFAFRVPGRGKYIDV